MLDRLGGLTSGGKRFRCRFGSSASPDFRDFGESSPRLVVARRARAMSSRRGVRCRARRCWEGGFEGATSPPPPGASPPIFAGAAPEGSARNASSHRPAPLPLGRPAHVGATRVEPRRRRSGADSPPVRPARSRFHRGPCRRRAMVQRGPLRGSCRRRTLAQRGPSGERALLTAGRAPGARRRHPVPPLSTTVASKEQPPGKSRGTDTTTRPRRGPVLAAKVGVMCW